MKYGKGKYSELKDLVLSGEVSGDITPDNIDFIVRNITNIAWFNNTRQQDGSGSFIRNLKHFSQIVARDLLKIHHESSKSQGLKAGYVYLISNPAWNLLKLGSAIDVLDRLNSYQTYSPNRDYALEFYFFSFDRREDERILLNSYTRSGEWVDAPKEQIIAKMKSLAQYR